MPRLTAEDVAARKFGLGASEIPELLGLSPWEGSGPMRLWMSKTGTEFDAPPDADRQAAFEYGHLLEPLILDWYERTTGRQLLPGGHVPHRDLPWLWATLDACAPDRIVEVKNVSGFMARHWDTSREDGIPRYVRVQVIVGQMCLGRHLTDVVASIGGRPPHVWTVGFDSKLADLILRRAAEFFGRVVEREPPPIDHSDASRKLLLQMYPTNEDRRIIPAPPELERIAQERIECAETARQAERTKAALDNLILASARDCDGIEGDGWKMTWKADKNGTRRSRFTASASREE